MKRVVMLLMAALLLFGMSGQAMAYFEEGHLIQVVYERGGTKEIVTDLGNRLGIDPVGGLVTPRFWPVVTRPTDINLADLGATSWENVYVAYFMRYIVGGNVYVWVSGDTTGIQVGKGSGGNALISKIGDLAGANMQTGSARNVNLQSSPTSFASLFGRGTPGTFEGFLTTPTGEANLAALATPGASVKQYLYYYNAPTNARLTYNGVAVLTAETFTNKAVVSPVPIPATAYLLGAGLLGLVGIRRRTVKNAH